jgi:hypothetical protein
LDRTNTGFVRAISVPTFDTTADTYEVKAWQDTTSGGYVWPVDVWTPFGGLGYGQENVHWTAKWLDSSGGLVMATNLLNDAPATPGTVYRVKIQLAYSPVNFYLDLGDGSGYQLAHSRDGFTPVCAGGHFILQSSDLGWTYYDDDVVSRVIPEPSSSVIWSLLGILGIALSWWRRGRRAA